MKQHKGSLIAACTLGVVMLMFMMMLGTTTTITSMGGAITAMTDMSDDGDTSDCDNLGTDDTDSDTSGTLVTGDVKTFVDKFAKLASNTGKKYNIPPEAILAQAAFESGWAMSAPQHNYFGIKAWSGCNRGATTGTQEDTGGGMVNTTATWCGYEDAQAGYDGYGAFIRSNPRYDESKQFKRDPYKYLESIWRAGYATDGAYMAKIGPIVNQISSYIAQSKIIPSSSTMSFDDLTDVNTDDAGSSATTQTTLEACKTSASGGKAEAGAVGGAPEHGHDYSWMCSWGNICTDGDGLGHKASDKNFYKHDVGRYQCVWYAWNRLAMIHGTDGWTWVLGNGGDIANNLSHRPGWTVDATPKPGDGVSQVGGALGGTPPFGHIAVVEEVKTEGGKWKIRISEGNYNTGGSGAWTGYNSRWLTQDQFNGAGDVFFRFNGWKK